ncbi:MULTISPECIES: hypothetical protein [Henriciella]|jgi:hypothetical protein|uniref:Activity regulator of membrane protease YbbK n=1 Tax=Henriciella pelagia TaxID=1977912 RepID=A0ABQ1JPG2_9PROT|nr:hypothetical protein [Henriciella pelagia]GGB73981.1 hypothetical protein GCM10011503_23410 [Henriciella pelagia]
MSAFFRAFVATVFVFEIAGAFALGFATLILLALHVHGIAFWSVEALTVAVVAYGSFLFFLRAYASEQRIAVEAKSGAEDWTESA